MQLEERCVSEPEGWYQIRCDARTVAFNRIISTKNITNACHTHYRDAFWVNQLCGDGAKLKNKGIEKLVVLTC